MLVVDVCCCLLRNVVVCVITTQIQIQMGKNFDNFMNLCEFVVRYFPGLFKAIKATQVAPCELDECSTLLWVQEC